MRGGGRRVAAAVVTMAISASSGVKIGGDGYQGAHDSSSSGEEGSEKLQQWGAVKRGSGGGGGDWRVEKVGQFCAGRNWFVTHLLKVCTDFPRVYLMCYLGQEIFIYDHDIEGFLQREFVMPISAHP